MADLKLSAPPPSPTGNVYLLPSDMASSVPSPSSSSAAAPVLSSISNAGKQKRSGCPILSPAIADVSPRAPSKSIAPALKAAQMSFQRDENVVIMDGVLVKKIGPSNAKKLGSDNVNNDSLLSFIPSDQCVRPSSPLLSSSRSSVIMQIPFTVTASSHPCKRNLHVSSYDGSPKIKLVNRDDHGFQNVRLSPGLCKEPSGRYVIPQYRHSEFEVSSSISAQSLYNHLEHIH